MNIISKGLLGLLCVIAVRSYSVAIEFDRQFDPEVEVLSAGRLSSENEQFIQKLVGQVEACQFIQVRQPSQKLMELRPESQFIYFSEQTRYLFINEPFFDLLEAEEKTYIISSIMGTPELIAAIKKIEALAKKKTYVTFTALAVKLGVGAIAAWYMPINWLYFNILKRYSIGRGIAKFVMAATVLGVLPIDRLYTKYLDQQAENIALESQIAHIKRFNCLDGAIGFNEKMLIILAPLVEDEPEYWLQEFERIKHLLNFYCSMKEFQGSDVLVQQ